MPKDRIYPIAWHFVNAEGEEKSFALTEEALVYLAASGCTCRPIPVPDMGIVMIGGVDDCPVHGFGTGEDQAVDSSG